MSTAQNRIIEDYSIINTIQNTEHIGTFPAVTKWILDEMKTTDLSIEKLCNRLADDPTICSQILKLANSPHFYRGNHITSLFHAVVHIGTDNIKRIILAIELIGVYRGTMDYSGFNQIDFWRHSLAGAMIVEALAKRCQHINPETCFLCAILRNIGIPFIRQFFPDKFKDILHFSIDSPAVPYF